MQAIQAGNELAAANGAVLNQLNETMIGLGQVITTKDIVDADRQATQDAAMLQFLGGQEVPMAGGAPLRFQQ
jgi:conjugal transfer/entry exclusion protein